MRVPGAKFCRLAPCALAFLSIIRAHTNVYTYTPEQKAKEVRWPAFWKAVKHAYFRPLQQCRDLLDHLIQQQRNTPAGWPDLNALPVTLRHMAGTESAQLRNQANQLFVQKAANIRRLQLLKRDLERRVAQAKVSGVPEHTLAVFAGETNKSLHQDMRFYRESLVWRHINATLNRGIQEKTKDFNHYRKEDQAAFIPPSWRLAAEGRPAFEGKVPGYTSLCSVPCAHAAPTHPTQLSHDIPPRPLAARAGADRGGRRRVRRVLQWRLQRDQQNRLLRTLRYSRAPGRWASE